jgi:UDP-N-acetylmuramyl pentapeptide phosphotransferase/UDP-N-acetylglucosamine-1-phosphate transferase
MYIPNSGEMTVFIAAFVGALIGFLWYNSYPASVFMGDTGSLTIGGIIAVLAISVRKELLIPLLCGIFLSKIYPWFSSKLFQIHQKTIWRRKKNFPNVAITSSLSEKRLSRK